MIIFECSFPLNVPTKDGRIIRSILVDAGLPLPLIHGAIGYSIGEIDEIRVTGNPAVVTCHGALADGALMPDGTWWPEPDFASGPVSYEPDGQTVVLERAKLVAVTLGQNPAWILEPMRWGWSTGENSGWLT